MSYLGKFGCWKTYTYVHILTYGNWNKTSGYVKKWNFFWAPGTHNYRSGGVISLCVYDVACKMVKAFLNMLAWGTSQTLASIYKINYWVFLSVCLSVSLFLSSGHKCPFILSPSIPMVGLQICLNMGQPTTTWTKFYLILTPPLRVDKNGHFTYYTGISI